MTSPDPHPHNKEGRTQPPTVPRPTRPARLRPLLLAGLCTLTLGLTAGGCGTTQAAGPTGTTSASAPATSAAPSTTTFPTPSSTSEVVRAAPCEAENLSAAPVTATPMGMTQTAYRVRVINNGPDCLLHGYPHHLTGLARTGKVHPVPALLAEEEDRILTSGQPADVIASGGMAEFVLHTAQACESERTGPAKSESYTRLWFSPPGQPGRVTVVAGKPVDAGPQMIALFRCATWVTRFYEPRPAVSTESPTPESTPSPNPTGILDERETPASTMDFMPGNRWHGTVAGQDVNVYAGSAAGTHMGTGKVIVDFREPGSGHALVLSLLAPHSGPLMIVDAPRPARLTLWDAHGYRHTLILAGPKTLEYKQRGPRAAIPADAVMPAAGVCGGGRRHLVTVGVGAGAAYPRCVQVFADEALRVENRSDDQPPRTSVTLGFPTLPATTLRPGKSVGFAHPFAGLAPGVHYLHLDQLAMDVWVR